MISVTLEFENVSMCIDQCEKMAWRCSICLAFFALTLRILISHMRTHANDPHFVINCDVDGCPESYNRINSYYRHVLKKHAAIIDKPHSARDLKEIDGTRSLLDDRNEPTSDHLSVEGYGNETACEQPYMEGGTNEADSDNHDNDANSDQEVSDDEQRHQVEDFQSKEMAINYILKLKEFHAIKETSVQAIVNGTDTFVKKTVDYLKQKVCETLHGEGIHPDTIPGLNQLFDEFVLPFDDIQSTYERNKYIKENYFYVEPEEIVLGQQLAVIRRNRQRHLDLVQDKYYYIPLHRSIEQLLQKRELLELALHRQTQTFDGQFYCDISDGSVFREHPIFREDCNGLQILLYFDDIEICSPISKKAGVHKLGVFYYSLANFPIQYRSRLPLIRLLAIIKRKHLKRYGMDRVLHRIKEDLNLLEVGVSMNLAGREFVLKGALLGFVGDTLAAHEFAGFKEGVGFAYQKCRECECTFIDMQAQFQETAFILRSLLRYDLQTTELRNAQTSRMRERLSVAYGINRRSAARDFPHFDLINMVPEDIMHVLFEGVVIYETKLVLKTLFGNGLCTLQQLNIILDDFPYGYKHKECKPNIIPEKLFEGNDDTMTLKQSSSSMIVLNRLLPFFLVGQLKVNSDNPYVQFITELCELVQIILAPVISVDTIQMLKILISRHLRKFKELFPNNNMTPKQHYMIHLPAAIEKYGPLTRVWAMRFESKHQFLKQRLRGSNNYKNVEKSLIERSGMYECALNVGEQHPLLHNDLEEGKASPVENIADAKQKINAFFGTDEASIKQVYCVSWVICNGQKFIAKQCEVAFGENSGLPEFGHLCFIWVALETVDNITQKQIYFGLSMYETLGFDNTVQAHLVEQSQLAQGVELVHNSSIFVPYPLHSYNLGNHKYIPVSYDMIDLVNYKRHSTVISL